MNGGGYMPIIVFGEKEKGKEYIWRPAVYGLMFNTQKNKIAVLQTNDGQYFLPGGGIEKNESYEECLKREAMEEMGMEVEIGTFLGCAQRYFYSTNELKYYLSEGNFYLCEMIMQLGKPLEEDHTLKWLELEQAIERLFHDHQSWAVKNAIQLFRSQKES
jgi:8-oxo-dGTP diphosphatase